MPLKPLRIAFAVIFAALAGAIVCMRVLEIGSPYFGPVKLAGLLIAIMGVEAALSLRAGAELAVCLRRNANFLLAALVTLLGFVAVEVGARMVTAPARGILAKDVAATDSPYQGQGDYYGRYATAAQMEFNDFTGYLPRKNTDGAGYHTNAQYLRYDQDLGPKQPGERRIVFTGGSAAWGAGVAQQSVYSALMDHGLREARHDVRVASAGVGGFSSTQERILIENHLFRLRPDVIVMFTGWNDALYGYQGIDILQRQNFVDHEAILDREWYRMGDFKRLAPPVYGEYPLKTGLLIDQALYHLRYRNAAELAAKLKPIQRTPDQVYDSFLYNLKLAHAAARESGTELVVCLQPSLYATRKRLNSYEQGFIESNESSSVGYQGYNRMVYDLYRSRLPSDLNRLGITFWDGDDALAGETQAAFADNVHLGDRGNRLLAEFFLPHLQPWIAQ